MEIRNSAYQQDNGVNVNQAGIVNGLSGFSALHLGDPDYYQGCLYVPMETAVGVPQGQANIDIGIFIATNLVRYAAISVSNYQSECSAVCIDPALSNSVALFASNWASAATNSEIFEYSVTALTNLTFVKVLPLSQSIYRIQGIICVGGMLYVLNDVGSSGNIYQIDPTNGTVAYLVQLNIANQVEWEGLDYFQGFLVANEGHTGTADWFDFFGVLSNSVNRTIAGSVKDNNNNPIAGVGVSATATLNGTNLTVSADTDTNGNYVLNVTNGSWNVAVSCCCSNDSLDALGNYFCPAGQSANISENGATINFSVQICSVSITTLPLLPAGEAGAFYTESLQANSCNPSFTWVQTAGSLPAGLSLSNDGTLSGTPAGSGGVFGFTAQVTDGNNVTTNQTFSVLIRNAVQIATTSLPVGTSGSFYNTTLSANSGQSPYFWGLSPGSASLPANLTLSPNGVLSGTATTTGKFLFSARATDSLNGIADQPFLLNLQAAIPPLLTIGSVSGQVVVVWSASATNYVLQSSTNLFPPNWLTVSNAAPGSAITVSNPAPILFFRLY